MAAQSCKLTILVAVLVSFHEFPASVKAAQCMPDPTNPCKARCNGTMFDISGLFDYP